MTRLRLALLAVIAMSSLQAAELELGEQEMSIGFDYSEIDMRKDEHHFRGNVRISQGPMFITADTAVAQGASQNDDSRWTFERNVHVQTSEADLRAATATAQVVNGAITNATVKGSPAMFEQRNATADQQVRGRAGQIEYDFARGIIRMSNDVWFSYGGNEFEGAVVVYYVRDERVVVNPEGKNQGRVNITVRPRPGATSGDRSGSASSPDSENDS
jgi:lipopolysaccharide transport protein LptA